MLKVNGKIRRVGVYLAIFSVALFLMLGAALVPGMGSAGSVELAQADAATEAGVEETMLNLPLYFVENQGQMDERVAYYVQGSDKTLYFTAQGVTFVLSGPGEDAYSQERYALKLAFVGADPDVQPVGKDRTEAIISYFKGSPEEWKTGLPTYAGVAYPDLWPGIDLVYSGGVSQLKYTFLVHPGVDPSRIQLAYDGASAVTLNDDGQMEVITPAGGFNDDRPVAYQDIGGQRLPVEAGYALDEEAHSYGFQVGSYDPDRPLVIDPAVLVYCGYIGGSAYDYGSGIAVDGFGNAYVTGSIQSDQGTFPVTVGPDLSLNGGQDALVAKVKADGSGLVYCGYIGGSDSEFGVNIAVDGSGNAYVTGYTHSDETTDNFPVAVGPDVTYNGDWEGFVAKVNAGGTALDYCGYIGGSDYDRAYSIAVDSLDNAYVTGNTSSDVSEGFPVIVGPDVTYNGDSEAFVAKVKADGSGLDYCGYIGGSEHDVGRGIAVDDSGNAYIAGGTYSDQGTFPDGDGFDALTGPDLTHNGDNEAFVAKVKADGSELDYCGYIGGSDWDRGTDIAVDSSGNAYVVGDTDSDEGAENFPVIVGPDLSYNDVNHHDVFVAKVKADGTGLDYCGYIGGADVDWGRRIAVDGSGNAYVAGRTGSAETEGFPVTVGPDLIFNGGRDAFVARVKAGGTALDYCGYIGGSEYDSGHGIAVDGSGNAYIAGSTYSDQGTFPETVGPDLIHNGDDDAFVAKVSFTVGTTDDGVACFIATAAYGTSSAAEIDTLRVFRDNVLLESDLGSQLVEWYYQTSPPVADFISGNSLLKTIVREVLVDPIASLVEATEAIWGD